MFSNPSKCILLIVKKGTLTCGIEFFLNCQKLIIEKITIFLCEDHHSFL